VIHFFRFMGFLRIYLALCVISSHTTGIFFGYEQRGDQAVQIFFAISGFYMAMILSESYTSKTKFYISRATRIYVPYFAILFFLCLFSCISGLASGQWLDLAAYAQSPLSQNGAAGVALAVVSNVTIFFQDSLLFLRQDLGQHLQFTTNFANSQSMLWHYLIMPQSWSVALELYFYVLAPFLNGLRTNALVAIMTVSTGLRTYLYNDLHLNFDPWTYRFFPCEISTFLIGMLGYRIYRHFKGRDFILPQPTGLNVCWFYGALLGALLIYARIIKEAEKLGVISYLAFFPLMIIIPLLFSCSLKSKFDRFIGELSFPVYLLHYAMIPLGLMIVGVKGFGHHFLGLTVALISIGLAMLVLKLLISPLENWRKRFRQSTIR
jgi:peptidoglycan/LPS O-acetylase OafA/YrhL